nr:hypothetical protein [Tanacetum cinerariifolium]
EKAVTLSNLLFNSNDDFTSSDDESLSNEDVPDDNFKIYSIPLFEFDDEIISKFVSENSNADIESFFPSPIPNEDSDSHMKEIDLFLTLDDPMPPSIEDDDDSKRDILIHEELLDNYSLSLPENESFRFDIPSSSRPPAKPPDDNIGILNIKMMGDISEQKDVLEDKVKIYSNHLFEFDNEYISSDVNPLFDEVLGDIKDSYVSNLDEPDLFVTPLFDANEDKCFDPGDDVTEIKLLLHCDPSTPKMKNEWKKNLYDTLIDDLMTEDKVFDPGIWMEIFSLTYVRLPFKHRRYLFFTYVIRIFLPYFTYPVDSSFLLSSGSEDTIFDPDIFTFHLEPVASHRSVTFMCFNAYSNFLNESPMEICSSTRFDPNITMIWGESS